MLHTLSAAIKSMGALGTKVYATSRKGAQFHLSLFDGKTGALLALMQADWLGQARTGAASGIATKYMTHEDATEVGLFGSGRQARTQLMAVCKVRKVRQVHIYSPNEERRKAFATEMSQVCQTEVIPVAQPELAAREKDIVITATSSREPVLHSQWVSQGTHINAIGSNFLGKVEVDTATVRRCASVVVDSKDQARLEAGDLTQAIEEGSLHWADVRELGQVVVGRYIAQASARHYALQIARYRRGRRCRGDSRLCEGAGGRRGAIGRGLVNIAPGLAGGANPA